MRSFGETPGKREALLNKLVKISETPVKREETPEKGEEPGTALCGTWLRLAISEKERGWMSIPGGFTPQFRRLETGVPM